MPFKNICGYNQQMKLEKLGIVMLLVVLLNGLTIHDKIATTTRKAIDVSSFRGDHNGTSFEWKYQGNGKFIGFSGRVGHFVNTIQLHFSDGTESPVFGSGLDGTYTYSHIPEDAVIAKIIKRIADDGLQGLDVMTIDRRIIKFGVVDQTKDVRHESEMNGGKFVGLFGTIHPKGYISSIGLYMTNKGVSYGTGRGFPFNWEDGSVGRVVKITGKHGEYLDGIQLHFADGKSTPYFGGQGGAISTDFAIDFTNDPLKQIVFRSMMFVGLFSVDFVKKSGLKEKVGLQVDEDIYSVDTLNIDGRRIVAVFGATDYEYDFINNLGFDLAE